MHKKLPIALVITFLFLCSAAAFGQATGGAITGTVLDANGGAVPNATDNIKNKRFGRRIQRAVNRFGFVKFSKRAGRQLHFDDRRGRLRRSDAGGQSCAQPYVRAGLGAIANAGRNTLHSNGFNRTDVSLLKNFRFTERFNLQLGAEFFDFFDQRPQTIRLSTRRRSR